MPSGGQKSARSLGALEQVLALAILMAGGVMLGGSGCKKSKPRQDQRENRVTGVRPDRPDRPEGAVGIGTLGSRPDRPPGVQEQGEEPVPIARVRIGELAVDDGVDEAAAVHVLSRARECMRLRYQHALKSDPGLDGKVKVCLRVDPLGKVSETSVEKDSVGVPSLIRELLACLKRLRFPPTPRQEQKQERVEVCALIILERSEE